MQASFPSGPPSFLTGNLPVVYKDQQKCVDAYCLIICFNFTFASKFNPVTGIQRQRPFTLGEKQQQRVLEVEGNIALDK